LVGEELLPRKLEAWERFHSRVSAWAPAQRVSHADAEKLAPIYCPDVELTSDVHDKLCFTFKRQRTSGRDMFNGDPPACQLFALDQVGMAELANIALPADRAPDRRV
jgi:hypothetical protein